jgi:hypothetical protein
MMVVVLLSSCSLKKMTTHTVGAISYDGAAALESEADVELARESLLPLIKSLEVFSAGDPNDRRYLALLAKSYGQYAFGFFEEDMLRTEGHDAAAYAKARGRADAFYAQGKTYGQRALSSKSAMRKALTGPLPEMEKALHSFGKNELPVMFWSAFCWGNWLNLHRDDPTAFIDTPRVQALFERVVALDPGFNYGSGLSALGVIHASRPAMLGGDAARAREYFDRAIAAAPGYLMHKVLMAQYLAVQMQDRALFAQLLNEVRAADAAALPAQRLANELAKRRAALLLEREKNFF